MSIAFVLIKIVLRELAMPFSHHTVSRDLGNYAGGSDAHRFSVSTDDRGLRLLEDWNRKTVDQKMVRLDR